MIGAVRAAQDCVSATVNSIRDSRRLQLVKPWSIGYGPEIPDHLLAHAVAQG